MAAEWRMQEGEKEMARKVCDRVYETLDDLSMECQSGDWPYDSHLMTLSKLRQRLSEQLPFDPEAPSLTS